MKKTKIALLSILLMAVGGVALAASERGKRFERADRDSNGIITLDEMEQARLARFGRADADGNGAVTRAELEAISKGRMAKKLDRMWNHLDSNGDGEISEAESAEHGAKRFAMMDTDGDGRITRDEAQAHRKHRRSQHNQAE